MPEFIWEVKFLGLDASMDYSRYFYSQALAEKHKESSADGDDWVKTVVIKVNMQDHDRSFSIK